VLGCRLPVGQAWQLVTYVLTLLNVPIGQGCTGHREAKISTYMPNHKVPRMCQARGLDNRLQTCPSRSLHMGYMPHSSHYVSRSNQSLPKRKYSLHLHCIGVATKSIVIHRAGSTRCTRARSISTIRSWSGEHRTPASYSVPPQPRRVWPDTQILCCRVAHCLQDV
jgi:hypothetical protein